MHVGTSMTESRISGAEEPRAMSVRLDTVSFQIRTVVTVVSPLGLVMVTCFSWYDFSIQHSHRAEKYCYSHDCILYINTDKSSKLVFLNPNEI